MSIKKNFIFNVILSVSQIIFPIITFPYITRVLLPKGLGTITFIDGFVQYLVVASALGIPMYGVREISRIKNDKEKLSKTYSELIIIHTVLSVFCSIVLWILAQVVPQLMIEYQLCMIGIGIILSNVFLINWFYAGMEKFAFISIVSIIIRLLTVVCIFIFIKSSGDKVLYYSFNLIGNIITGIICMIFALKSTSFTIRALNFSRHLRSLFLLFSLTVITSVYVLLDSVILGFIQNNTEVGYYSTAMKLSKIPITLLTALTSVMIPRLSSLQSGEEFRNLVNKSLSFSFLISIPIAFGLFVLSREFILIFAGDLYLPALNAFRILSFMIIPIGFALVNYQILLPYNKERYMMTCSVIGVICSLLLNFIFTPYIGNVGSAISSLGTEIIVSIVLFALSYKLCNVRIPYKMIFYSVITCSSFFGVKYSVYSFSSNQYVVVIATGICSSIVYFILMAFVFKIRLITDIGKTIISKINLKCIKTV